MPLGADQIKDQQQPASAEARILAVPRQLSLRDATLDYPSDYLKAAG
jgi:hypothetical protein